MRKGYQIGLWLIVWLAFWLRVRGLFANTFQADEALFATWARHVAVWKDPLLLTQTVDKPPLLFYLQAFFYPLFGPVEWAARMPNLIASILVVPLTAVLAHYLYHQKTTTLTAALLLACSPLAIQFSATAFTDPLLTLWLIASLASMQVASGKWQVASGKWQVAGGKGQVARGKGQVAGGKWQVAGGKWQVASRQVASGKWQAPLSPHHPITPSPAHLFISGIFFGLAVATKYQAWLFLPLVGGLGWICGYRHRHWLYWLAGLLPVLAAVWLWEYTRTGTFTLWSTQISNYGGVRLIWSWELWPRFVTWVGLWGTAVPLYLLPVLLLIMVGLLWRLEDEHGQVDLLLVLFVIGYWLLHWLTAVPVWDRYLLPLVPIVAILMGRGFSRMQQIFADKIKEKSAFIRAHPHPIFLLFLLIILLIPAWGARYGRYPIGGRPDADQGAAQIASYLQDAPYGTVLYDHWYSWHWRYHFFDKGVYVSWFPHGEALAEDLAVFGLDGYRRYIALPDTAVSQPIIRAIQNAGFTLQPVTQAGNIILYLIAPDEVIR
jgi:2-amino-4-hydroxy-6-hydroxymethyldihydropteridine diphosphokinase